MSDESQSRLEIRQKIASLATEAESLHLQINKLKQEAHAKRKAMAALKQSLRSEHA